VRWSVGVCAVTVGLVVGAGCAARGRSPREPEGNPAAAGTGAEFEATFVRAGRALSAGDLALAKSLTAELRAHDPGRGDGRVLAALVARREAHPGEDWVDAFALAWRDVWLTEDPTGPRPQLTAFVVHPPFPEDIPPIPPAAREAVAGEPAELLLAIEDERSGHRFERLIQLSLRYSTPDAPLSIRLLAFALLSPINRCHHTGLPRELCGRARARTLALAEDLSRERPDAILFPLWAALDGSDVGRPLSARTLAQLQNAARRAQLTVPRFEAYAAYKQMYAVLGIAKPELRAATIVNLSSEFFSMVWPVHALEDALKAAGADQRAALAEILESVGRAYVRRGTFLDWQHGARLLHLAARQKADPVLEQRAALLRSYSALLLWDVGGASSLEVWPVEPLSTEAIELRMQDEIALNHRLLGLPMPHDLASLLLSE